MAVPVVTCGSDQILTYSGSSQVVNLTASATNSPTSYAWTLLSVPPGSTALTEVRGNFTNGVATVQNPSFTTDAGIEGTYCFQCIATNADGPSVPTNDKENGQQNAVVKTQSREMSLPSDYQWDWGGYNNNNFLILEGIVDTNAASITSLTTTVNTHATRHQSGGADAIKLDDLAAPDDNTDLNASVSAHGLLPKLSGTATQYLSGVGTWTTPSSTDTDAIHDNVAGEIAALSLVTVDGADHILIEDAGDSNNKKRIAASDLLSGATDADAIHDNVAAEINAIASKGTLGASDLFIIEDSADSWNKKKISATVLNDFDAIHDNVAGEINTITEKTSVAGSDWLLIEDSADSWNKKKVSVNNFDDLNAIHDDTASEISAITEKVVPASGDFLIIEDSAAGNVKKRVLVGNLPGADGVDTDAIHSGVANEFASLAVVTASNDDYLLIEDSDDSWNKKRVSLADLLSGAGIDTTAFHNDTANEFTLLTQVEASGLDLILIEDASDSYNKKSATASGIQFDIGAIHSDESVEFPTHLQEKTVPSGIDLLVIEDSSNNYEKGYIQVENLCTFSPIEQEFLASGDGNNQFLTLRGIPSVNQDMLSGRNVLGVYRDGARLRYLEGVTTANTSSDWALASENQVAVTSGVADEYLTVVYSKDKKWTPAEASSAPLGLWLDASDSSTILHVDGDMVSWYDKSSNLRDGSGGSVTGGVQPQYLQNGWHNGMACLDWGTTSNDKNIYLDNSQATYHWHRVFIVCQWDGGGTTWPSYVSPFASYDGTGANPSYAGKMLQGENSTNDWRTVIPAVASPSRNGGEHSFYNNFEDLASPTILNFVSVLDIFELVNGYTVGNDRRNAGRGWRGRIAEVVVFEDEITTEEIKKVEGYLSHKWDVPLSQGHPYKDQPPVSNVELIKRWTPDRISTGAWFDAMDASTITLDVIDHIEGWDDKSGNEKHLIQATSSWRPDYSLDGWFGLPCIDWGTESHDKRLWHDTGDTTDNWQEVYIVGMMDQTGWTAWYDGVTSQHVYLFNALHPSGTASGIGIAGSAGTANWQDGAWLGGTAMNGEHETSLTSFPSVTKPFILRAPAKTTSVGVRGIAIGGDRTSWDNRGWRGRTCEVIVLNDIADNATRYKIEGYLAHKWLIQDTLVAGHPYRKLPPVL
jgi:hypothetical protein